MSNETRLESMALRLPGAERVNIEAWDGHPTFRVNGKNFVFAAGDFSSISVLVAPKKLAKLVIEEDA